MLLTVNYHYFRDPEDSEYPGIHGVSLNRFEKQVYLLSKHFEFIRPSEIIEKISNNKNNKFCLFTFDDGFREQFDIALPILKKYGAHAIFNINGCNLSSKIVSDVHKIHWLRSITPEKLFMEQILDLILTKNIDIPIKFKNFRPIEAQNIYDSLEIRYIKYLFNNVLEKNIEEK